MTIIIKPKLTKPCAICQWTKDKDGYGRRKYRGKKELAHRVAYAEANGLTMADIKGVVIRHKCDNPPCIEPTHLLAGTNLDNIRDKMQRGHTDYNKGDANPRAKLTDDQVRTIKQRLAEGSQNKVLAAEYGINCATISGIKHGKNWSHVNG
jgi:hypothetical protein